MKKLMIICLVVIVTTWSSGIAYGQNTQETKAESTSKSGAVIEGIDIQGPGSSRVISNPSSQSGSTAGAEAKGGEAVALSLVNIISNYRPDGRAFPVPLPSAQGPFFLPNGSVHLGGPVGSEASVYEVTLDSNDIRVIRMSLNDIKRIPYKGIFEEFFDSFSPHKPNKAYYERKGFKIANGIRGKGFRRGDFLTIIEDLPPDDLINRKALLRRVLLEKGYVYVGDLGVEGGEQESVIHNFTGHSYMHNFTQANDVGASLLWEAKIDVAILDGGMQSFGKGQTVSSAGSVAYPTNNIGSAGGIVGLNQRSEIRARPVTRFSCYRYSPSSAKKSLISNEFAAMKDAILSYQPMTTQERQSVTEEKDSSKKSKEEKIGDAKKIEAGISY